MCEQCQAFDDDDEDALAAAFLARHGKTEAPSAPPYALVHPKAGPKPVLPAKKAR